ncbi:MAG: MraY family glycosyltransferase [Nitriliruptoraceae bacterium]
MLAHLVVALVAAVVTAVACPVAARLARGADAMAHPPDTGQERPPPRVPTLGGIAMALGVLAALGTASLLPSFGPLFTTTSEPIALLAGVLVIVAIGIVDDLRSLPPTVKLAGQIVAALGVVVFGVQLVHFWIPGLEVIVLSRDLGLPLTVLALVAMINAVNLIDGLDGLAAGVSTIAAVAFFLFAVRSQPSGLVDAVPTSATLVVALVAGASLGFLIHNWHPARLYMGDTGSMLLGLLLGVAGVSYVGRTTAPSNADFYGAIPLLVPVLVLAVPFADTAFAVVRRLVRRRPVTGGDLGHLHHLLLAFGHSHRRAVLILYYWSAVLAFGSVAPSFLPLGELVPWMAVAGAIGVVLTVLGTRVGTPEASGQERSEVAEVPGRSVGDP